MKKTVFFDVDGTIYHNDTGVVKDAAEGIRRIRANGHRAFICTGRARAGLDDGIVNIGFDGIVAACGTYIEVDGKVLKNETVPETTMDRVVETLGHQEGCYLILEGYRALYMALDVAPPEEKRRFARFVKENRERIHDLRTGIGDVNKFSIRLDPSLDYREVLKEFRQDFAFLVHTPFALELVPHGFTKGSGVRDVMAYYQEGTENTVGFGDGINDIPMLEAVRTAVVMGNGQQAAKDHADFITKPLLDGGIGYALEILGLFDHKR